MAIPVYTLEVVLLEVRGILEDKSDKWAEEQFVLNFINPFIFTMLFSGWACILLPSHIYCRSHDCGRFGFRISLP